MKASLKAKLEQLLERYVDLGALLSDSDVIADQGAFRNYSMEYSEIEPVVFCFRQYEQTQAELDEAQTMATDTDPEIRAMAENCPLSTTDAPDAEDRVDFVCRRPI